MKTPAYISVQGQKVGKLELQDDWTRQEYGGGFRMNFTVHNLFDQELTYNMKAVLLVPGTDTVETQYGTRDVMLASDVLLREVDLGSVTVPASGIADVKKIVPLTEEEKADLNAKFKNGTYVEGFIILTDASEAEEKNHSDRSALPGLLRRLDGCSHLRLRPVGGRAHRWRKCPQQ